MKSTMIKYLALFLMTCIAISPCCMAHETLTFVKTDGTTVSLSTDGLAITYDDYAHAVVSNRETSATIDLADVDYMCFGEVESTVVTGDVNGDGEVNVADVNSLISIILGGKASDDTMTRADVNNDGEVNVADVNTLINLILTA